MAWQESDLQAQMAVELDRSTTPPAVTTSDYLTRRAVLDRANRDWAESYDWSPLLKIFNGNVSTSDGNASYALPADFKKLDGNLRVGGLTSPLLVINPTDNGRYLDSDNFVNLLGNENTGYVMFLHAGTLASGTSIQFTYFSQVTSLSTTTSVSPCPDPTFLVQRALYYVYKAIEDQRFPEAKAESDRILARMIENENAVGKAYVDRTFQVPSIAGFRIGRE
jgi:hypothetical protein